MHACLPIRPPFSSATCSRCTMAEWGFAILVSLAQRTDIGPGRVKAAV